MLLRRYSDAWIPALLPRASGFLSKRTIMRSNSAPSATSPARRYPQILSGSATNDFSSVTSDSSGYAKLSSHGLLHSTIPTLPLVVIIAQLTFHQAPTPNASPHGASTITRYVIHPNFTSINLHSTSPFLITLALELYPATFHLCFIPS